MCHFFLSTLMLIDEPAYAWNNHKHQMKPMFHRKNFSLFLARLPAESAFQCERCARCALWVASGLFSQAEIVDSLIIGNC